MTSDSQGPAIAEITKLLHRYAFAIDDKDWAALHDVFNDDCVADYGSFGSFTGADAVCAWMESAHVGLTTQHAMANITIDVDGRLAHSRSYVTVTLQPEGGAMFRTGGEYRDTILEADGTWRIERRTYRTIWQQQLG